MYIYIYACIHTYDVDIHNIHIHNTHLYIYIYVYILGPGGGEAGGLAGGDRAAHGRPRHGTWRPPHSMEKWPMQKAINKHKEFKFDMTPDLGIQHGLLP